MKDETARELVRKVADEELPLPSFDRVSMRATFEEQFEQRREPFRVLPWVQMAVYTAIGVAIAGMAIWAFLEFLT